MPTYRSASGSSAEDLFIELFSDTFGAEKAGYLYSQYPFSDIYQNSRFADFLIENSGRKVAIGIDDEASHNPKLISQNKFYDDLLKQNSMIYLGWDVYRWAVRQMQQQPETVKDELRVFLGQHPSFREIEDYLPTQRGKSLDGSQLELKEHQKQALAALEEMRCNFETIALLYHATGTGKTVTAVMDAKRFGKRTLFLAHTVELVDQATKTFRELWPKATVGRYVESMKQGNAFVVCGSIQSVALNLERFKPDDFGYIIVDEAHHASADTYQKVLSYFTPEFTLGLTATPERADDKNILDIFKKRALLRTVFCSGGIFFVEPRKAQGIVIPELFLYLLYAIARCFMRDDDELYLLEILQDFCNYLFIWFPCASGNKSDIAGCEFFYYGEIFAFADYLANPVETGISAYLYVFTYSYRGQ